MEYLVDKVLVEVIYHKPVNRETYTTSIQKLKYHKEELINFLCAKFKKELKYNDCHGIRRTLNLADCLTKFIDSGNDEELEAYRKWVKSYLTRKKAMLEKSIRQNRIVTNYNETERPTLSRRKQALIEWKDEYEKAIQTNRTSTDTHSNKNTHNPNEERICIDLNKSHEQFKIDNLCTALNETLTNQLNPLKKRIKDINKLELTSTTCAALKKTLQGHQAT